QDQSHQTALLWDSERQTFVPTYRAGSVRICLICLENQIVENPGNYQRATLLPGPLVDFHQVRAFDLASVFQGKEQHPQSTRRNVLPVKCINRSLLMRHEYLTRSLVQQMEISKTSSGADGVLHDSPETFNGVEVVPTMGG